MLLLTVSSLKGKRAHIIKCLWYLNVVPQFSWKGLNPSVFQKIWQFQSMLFCMSLCMSCCSGVSLQKLTGWRCSKWCWYISCLCHTGAIFDSWITLNIFHVLHVLCRNRVGKLISPKAHVLSYQHDTNIIVVHLRKINKLKICWSWELLTYMAH